VPILRFYNLISGVSMECDITWSTQLPTCHRFHESRFLLSHAADDEDELTRMRSRLSASRYGLCRS
jgi:hypothetical protein